MLVYNEHLLFDMYGMNIKAIFSVCLWLSYPACQAHVPRHMPSVASHTVQYICTLSHKRHDFRKKEGSYLNLKCVDTTLKTFLILRRTEQDITNVHKSECKLPVTFVKL
jgi:hypothetical protein